MSLLCLGNTVRSYSGAQQPGHFQNLSQPNPGQQVHIQPCTRFLSTGQNSNEKRVSKIIRLDRILSMYNASMYRSVVDASIIVKCLEQPIALDSDMNSQVFPLHIIMAPWLTYIKWGEVAGSASTPACARSSQPLLTITKALVRMLQGNTCQRVSPKIKHLAINVRI